MTRILLVAACVALLASAACADVVSLYSDDDYQLSGPTANGGFRAQHFCAISATPNPLDPMDLFDQAGFKVSLSAGETLSFVLALKPWDYMGYAASDALAPIAQKQFSLSGPGEYLCMLDPFTPQAAYGDYLLQMTNLNLNLGDWGLRRSSSNDGGPGNDAFTSTTPKTDREYQVYLNTVAVPEPASMTVLGLGLAALIRRRTKK